MKTVIEMAQEAGIDWNDHLDDDKTNRLDHFAELVRADERERITNVLLEMHDKASSLHNYYKHAALEINRK